MSASTSVRRHAYIAWLKPLLGSAFQPTGFPDLGAATFERLTADGLQRCLIVESVQSMANRLEGTAWDKGAAQPIDALAGLPYVRVVDPDGRFLTSSRTEAHRLFSAYIRDSDWQGCLGDAVLLEHLGISANTPLDYPAMARALMRLDPLSLLHGVFFAGGTSAKRTRSAWPAQPRITRAISGVIEAHGIHEVAYGGLKADSVRHNLSEDEVTVSRGGTAEGYGSVPFRRMEYTAASIEASFAIDVQLLRSYGLPPEATHLLETLALWEIRQFLDGGLRLRSNCDLTLTGPIVTVTGDDLPGASDLGTQLTDAIAAAAPHLGDGTAITVQWSARATKETGKAKASQ